MKICFFGEERRGEKVGLRLTLKYSGAKWKRREDIYADSLSYRLIWKLIAIVFLVNPRKKCIRISVQVKYALYISSL